MSRSSEQHFVEHVRLRVQQSREEEFLRKRPRAIEAITEKSPGLSAPP